MSRTSDAGSIQTIYALASAGASATCHGRRSFITCGGCVMQNSSPIQGNNTVALLKLSLRWEGGHRDRRYNFTIPHEEGEIRGEVDDSATEPVYIVQHCVVDTFDGRIVLPPTTDEARAEDLAMRLNAAMLEG